MPKTRAQPSRASVGTAGSWRVAGVVLAAAALALLPLLALWAADVPLGETSYLVYRYSPAPGLRLVSLLPLLLIVPVLAGAIRLVGSPAPNRRCAGLALLGLVLVSLAGWTWWAPPANLLQHDINFRSPAQDGAFLVEAQQIRSLGEYLRQFEQHIQRPPERMAGTRVLSNTPGMTVLAYAITHLLPADGQHPGWVERHLPQRDVAPQEELARTVDSIHVSLVLAAMLAGAGLFAYLLGRVFLSPLGAAALATVIVFSPATAHFSPGKDPAQLLTVCAMLWAWLAGWRRDSLLLSALAGALLMVGMAMGLIHLWVALAVLAAAAWQQWRTAGAMGRFLLRRMLPAALGAVALVAVVYLLCGWNMPGTFWAVARRFGQIQQIITQRLNLRLWLIIGVPLFLLFVGPAFWTFGWQSLRRFGRRASLGRRLLVCTAAIMLVTFLTGVPYELPRLWIPFLPLLLLAVMMELPLLHGRGLRHRAATAVALIVCVHVVATALHWSLLDVRESEYRLITQRLLR